MNKILFKPNIKKIEAFIEDINDQSYAIKFSIQINLALGMLKTNLGTDNVQLALVFKP